MSGRVAITGASGQLGRLVAERVLAQCAPRDVILATRSPDALSDFAARGAEIRHADFDEPDSLRDALVGAERMLLISATDLERRVAQHRAAIAAAKAAGVRRVIYTSGSMPEPPNPAAVAPSHYATEQALAASGLAWTVLRNSLVRGLPIARGLATRSRRACLRTIAAPAESRTSRGTTARRPRRRCCCKTDTMAPSTTSPVLRATMPTALASLY